MTWCMATEQPTPDTTETGLSLPRKLLVWAFRLGQVVSVGLAGIFVLGAIMGGMNILQFMSIGIVGILLLLFAIILEAAIRAVR